MPRDLTRIAAYAAKICHTVSHLRLPNQHKNVVLARNELIYKLREAGFVWQDIGSLLCRDHTTCITSYRRHKQRIQNENQTAVGTSPEAGTKTV